MNSPRGYKVSAQTTGINYFHTLRGFTFTTAADYLYSTVCCEITPVVV
ncbi:hypothetical protein EVA_15766 [gut metagenome]|uniref:Uncharacterized protein n=1 Tax=gut metagenome TaxID=749906 RepID=J9G2V1_9ZZZZ